MIIFLIYIIVLIYLYEFYTYIVKLKTKIRLQDNQTLNSIKEKFTSNNDINNLVIDPKLDPYCQMKPANYTDMSENMLTQPIYSYDALKILKVKQVPYPSDDTRVYENNDFNRKANYHPLPRYKRPINWHCIRDYMICHTPTYYLDQLSKPVEKSVFAIHREAEMKKNQKNQKKN